MSDSKGWVKFWLFTMHGLKNSYVVVTFKWRIDLFAVGFLKVMYILLVNPPTTYIKIAKFSNKSLWNIEYIIYAITIMFFAGFFRILKFIFKCDY